MSRNPRDYLLHIRDETEYLMSASKGLTKDTFVILMKDKSGRVIGFEKLNFNYDNSDMTLVNFETIIAN